MKHLQQKLHSKTGASMALALLFLFFCITVGAIIVTAASSNAGRLKRNRLDREHEMAVQSAALLLRDTLADMTLTGQYKHTEETEKTVTYEEQEDGSWLPQHSSTHSESYSSLPVTLTGTSLAGFAGLQKDLADLFYSQETELGVDAPSSIRYEMKITARSGASETALVSAVLTVNTAAAEQYAITAVLSLEDGTNAVTLYFPTLDSGLLSKSQTSTSHAPLGEGDYAGSVTTITVTTTYTQTIRWQAPEATKGVPS